jgi:NTE family protein
VSAPGAEPVGGAASEPAEPPAAATPRDAAAPGPAEPAAAPSPDTRALCLSGGGYRAMLFHVGALWRLNELGWLPKLDRISSVSGGSIAAGVLAKHWTDLTFDPHTGVAPNFADTVAAELMELAGKTIDVPAVLRGLLSLRPIGDQVARAYRRRLFHSLTLQDLPDRPRFVINATNLQSGALWRFSKPFMADYRVGQVRRPDVPLAVAVAASSAFPPVLSPVSLKLAPGAVVGFEDDPIPALHFPPYTTRPILSDGGVYDNLGLQTATQCHTVLVSDGGGALKDAPRPHRLWPLQLLRVLDVIDNQVRALRKHDLIDDYQEPDDRRAGTYWGIRSAIADYHVSDPLPAPPARVAELAATPTRLAKLALERRRRLVNWGYAIADAGMRKWVVPATPAPPAPAFPFPDAGV